MVKLSGKARDLAACMGAVLAGVFLIGVLLSGTVCAQSETDSGGEFPGKVRLILPEVIYAAPGVEVNVYFDNVTLTINPANYAFDVICSKGAQQVERWTYTPSADDVGDYPFAIEVRDEPNSLVARASATVRVAPADAGKEARKTVLIIGNSLTAASVYPQHLLDLCEGEGNPRLMLIGTREPRTGSGENRHEGYGGWTAKRFATHFTGIARGGDYKKCGSPFIYADGEGEPKLDFPRYCREFNNGKGPDFVTIFLGCNDTFRATDGDIEARIDTMFAHYDTLIRMVHGFRKDTRIGALLPAPPAATQDAFGRNYRSGQTRWQYKRNQHRLVERMVERYGGRDEEYITLVPAYVNLDCVHNYPQRTDLWNARASEKGSRLNNGVHPAAEGYRQIGDTLYCWLKARLAEMSMGSE